ncbi:IDEAL domain-containing protein [Aquibacillus sp. 3ASR75-11]|uniref:IDEAL domain-containing protein n=1 Tax=Terrihalobacillus insolitus TaxID=2950438 RepID=A0A9X4ALS1_9BACI|nr:IDEAL domain-containing protein [Terrihalobacillus insolitus]MDC3413556.1 IDEAL domain-containing protein [Terrihalobacillus insolitus]MDC3424687.1 IDEAL domain-containing protein [Terrihalobacillus insolitus]
MKKHKVIYKLHHFKGKTGTSILAKREVPYEIKLASSLFLDELCYNWNKARLEKEINDSIDAQDKNKFIELSKSYVPYTWE